MIQIPPGVSSPALIRDPITVTADGKKLKNMTPYRIIDLSVAKVLCKKLVARDSGTIYQRLIDGNGKKSRRKLPVFELKRDSEIVSSSQRALRLRKTELLVLLRVSLSCFVSHRGWVLRGKQMYILRS
jgi:hypothetical protein